MIELAKWKIVAYPDEENYSMGRKEKIREISNESNPYVVLNFILWYGDKNITPIWIKTLLRFENLLYTFDMHYKIKV